MILGSATPSLESWHAADQGRYLRLAMPGRIGGGALPRLRLVDMNHQPKGAVIAPPLLAAMAERIARGEQCLVLLNRRGYAPVLACHDCGWKSGCPHCSAYRVFHKLDRTLRCHHCGFTERVPRACPDCGNLDIAPVGRGTEQLEEQTGARCWSDAQRPDGQPPRVARMDADSTRLKGSLESQLAALHSGEVDVLVGTQMIAKGHDFRRITLVAGLNADSALFASDYRAPERLFALLMQAGGRAGRDAAFMGTQGGASEMWIQTWYPDHPLFATLKTPRLPGLCHRAARRARDRGHAALRRPGLVARRCPHPGRRAGLSQPRRRSGRWACPTATTSRSTPPCRSPSSGWPMWSGRRCWWKALRARRLAALSGGLAAGAARCAQRARGAGLVRWAVDVDPLTI